MSVFEFETRPDYKPTVIDRIRDVIGNALEPITHKKEKSFDPLAFRYPWDDDMRDALRLEIEEKPKGIDADALVGEAYSRLSELLGRPELSKSQVQKRVIFTDQAVLQAFRHIYGFPGENSDKYWANPFETVLNKNGIGKAVEMVLLKGSTINAMELVFIPNAPYRFLDPMKNEFTPTDMSREEYERDLKRTIAHELAHFLYRDKPGMRTGFTEVMADYIAGQVFPEVQLDMENYDKLKAAVEQFCADLGYSSLTELFNQPDTERMTYTIIDKATQTYRKFFGVEGYGDLNNRLLKLLRE